MKADLRLWHSQTPAERKATIKRRLRRAKAEMKKAEKEVARWREAWNKDFVRLTEMGDEG